MRAPPNRNPVCRGGCGAGLYGGNGGGFRNLRRRMACLRGILPSLFRLPSPWIPWIPAVLVIYICMAPRGLAEHALRVANALRSGKDGEARHAVSMIVREKHGAAGPSRHGQGGH